MQPEEILRRALERGASDIFVIAGLPLTYKINGRQQREGEMLHPADTAALIQGIYALSGRDPGRCAADDADDDFSFAIQNLDRKSVV